MSAYAYACVVSSLCLVYFSSPATLCLPPTTLAILSQPTHTGRGVSRPVKSRSYRHSGRTDSIRRCCYECYQYQRSQFTEDNVEPSFLPGINSLRQFTVPRTIRSFLGLAGLWHLLCPADARHIPMCMSVAAVPKQSPAYFDLTECSSSLQTLLSDAPKAKPVDLLQVLSSAVSRRV